jgi:hypothetical protein
VPVEDISISISSPVPSTQVQDSNDSCQCEMVECESKLRKCIVICSDWNGIS